MKRLILIVDMIKGFIEEGALADPSSAAIVPGIIGYLDSHDGDVIFLADKHNKNSREFLSYPVHCVSPEESEVIGQLVPYATRIVYKNSTNGFFALSTETDLKKYDEVVIAGVCTDICVLQLALTMKGFYDQYDMTVPVRLLKNCVSTFDAPVHGKEEFTAISLKLMKNAGIDII